MISIGLASIRGHFTRFIMTVVAVALGVSFVTATTVFTKSMESVFDTLVGNTSKGTDVLVRAKTDASVNDASGGRLAARDLLPLSYGQTLMAIEGVKAATPDIQGTAMVVKKDGSSLRGGGAPNLAFAVYPNDPVVKVVEGRIPTTDTEVLMEKGTLKQSGYKVGETADIVINGARKSYQIVGSGDAGPMAGATVVTFSEPAAIAMFAPEQTVPMYRVTAKEGVSQEQLRDAVAKTAPAGFETITGKAYAEETSKSIRQQLSFFNIFLMVFAIVALVVGIFIVVNTFLMLLAQRTQELAMLRAIGMRKRQVVGMVMIESLMIGLVGGLVGYGIGLGLGVGGIGLMNTQFEMEMSAGQPFSAESLIVALTIGVLVTVASALIPAIRASFTKPVAAMRAEATTARKSLTTRTIVGSALLVTGIGAGLAALAASGMAKNALLIVSCVAAFFGFLIVAAAVVKPVVSLLAALPAKFGSVPELARDNTIRNPRRTALTGSALMIGIALVTAVGVLASSATNSLRGQMGETIQSDLILSAGNQDFLATQVVKDVAAQPGVGAVDDIVMAAAPVNGKTETVFAMDPQAIGRSLKLDVVQGAKSGLSDTTVAIPEKVAEKQKWKVGDTLTFDFGTVKGQKLTVGSIYKETGLFNTILVPSKPVKEGIPEPQLATFMALVTVAPGQDPAKVRESIVQLVKPLLIVGVQTQKEYQDAASGNLKQLLMFVYGLLALSILIAAIGIANTLGMSIYERTREIGMLRAIGLKRGQLASMVTLESMWTSVFGAVVGTLFGLGMGVLLQQALKDQGLSALGVPWVTILVVVIGAAVVGIVASLVPAIRASRMKVLDAIAAE